VESGGLDNAEVVAWLCFVLGAIVLLVGLYLGLKTAPEKAAKQKDEKLKEARANLEETTSLLKTAASGNLEGGDAANTAEVAATKVEEAKSALEQVGSIIGSLPEHERFPGMLILVGAVLMSVGTIQFGGTAIF
jgi:hypothetical protein